MKPKLWLPTLFLCAFFAQGQTHRFGFHTSVILQVGTPINRIGVGISGYWLTPFSQLNIGNQSTIYFSGYGPRQSYFENRSNLAVIGLFGKGELRSTTYFGELHHHSSKNAAFGYSYLVYWDTRGTAQTSGAFGMQFHQYSFAFENDAFGFQGRDRFRTGRLTAAYLDSTFQLQLQSIIWTGESRGGQRQHDANYPGKFGYKDLSNTYLGKYSHGLLTLGAKHILPFNQLAGAEIGIDHERIRHFFQNRLVHDFRFSKKNPSRMNPHYPMLQKDGSPYLFKEEQHIRKGKPVIQVGLYPN
jgi:hypothetical protein